MKHYREFDDADARDYAADWPGDKPGRRDDYQAHGRLRKLRSRRRSGYLRKRAQREATSW